MKEMLIGFGNGEVVVVDHFRRQRLIEIWCERNAHAAPTAAEAELALEGMDPSELQHLELTGERGYVNREPEQYDANMWESYDREKW